MSFPIPLEVKSLGQYQIFISYSDGIEGAVDLSYLKEKPIFRKWESPDFFNKVYINILNKSVAWDEEIELCPDNLYLKLRKLNYTEYLDQLSRVKYATNQ
ncbi:MAG: DUF2442 domain-containing protein [Saprospiraceae bacterium]|nr:DUF2442 domain-containing protein [Saprospiraceae bacterium]